MYLCVCGYLLTVIHVEQGAQYLLFSAIYALQGAKLLSGITPICEKIPATDQPQMKDMFTCLQQLLNCRIFLINRSSPKPSYPSPAESCLLKEIYDIKLYEDDSTIIQG